MPNWCSCDLSIVGKAVELKRFMEFAETEDNGVMDFTKFIPEPQYKSSGDWYEWRIKHWGTKWNVTDPILIKKPRSLKYIFDTAWSPPEPMIRAMAEQFPTLQFNLRYYERGMGYQGQLMIKGTETLKEWEGDYYGSRGG